MLDEDQKEAYYKDLICNSYCPIEVPAAVRELRRQKKINFAEGMRQILTYRILEEAKRGGEGKYPPAHVQEMLEEINRPGSKYALRLKSRLYNDLEQRAQNVSRTVVNIEGSVYHRVVRIAKATDTTIQDFVTSVLKGWLDTYEGGIIQ